MSDKTIPMETDVPQKPEPSAGKGAKGNKRTFKRNKGKRGSHAEMGEISHAIDKRIGTKAGPGSTNIDCGVQVRTTLLPITIFGIVNVLRKYMARMQAIANKPLATFWLRPQHIVEASSIRVTRILVVAASIRIYHCLRSCPNPGDLPKLYKQQTIDRLKRSFLKVPKPLASALSQIGHVNVNSALVTPTFGMFDLNDGQDPNNHRRVGSLNFTDLVAWLRSGAGFNVNRETSDKISKYFESIPGFVLDWQAGVLLPSQQTVAIWSEELSGEDFDVWENFVAAHKEDDVVNFDLLELRGSLSQVVRLREHTEYSTAYANVAVGEEAAVLAGAIPLGFEQMLKKQCYLQSKSWFGARQWTIPTEDALSSLLR